jgi:hypothetical protein
MGHTTGIDKNSIIDAVATKQLWDVSIPEVWIRTVRVEAKNYDDAITTICEGIKSGRIELSGTDNLSFSHEMDRNSFDATKVDE